MQREKLLHCWWKLKLVQSLREINTVDHQNMENLSTSRTSYTALGILSSCHQRGLLCQKMGADAEAHSQILFGNSLNWRSSSGPSPRRSVNPSEEGQERSQESDGMEDPRRTWHTKSTKQGSYGLRDGSKKHRACMGSATGPLSML